MRHRTVVFGENPDAYETGPHVARIAVDLLSSGHHNANIDEIVTAWRARAGDIADAIAIKFAEPSIGLAGRAIDIRLHGDDMERLQSASRELRTWMRRFDGVVDLGDDLHPRQTGISRNAQTRRRRTQARFTCRCRSNARFFSGHHG